MAELFSEMAEEMAELFSEMAARWLERKYLFPILCKITVQKLHLLPTNQYGGLKVTSVDPDEWEAR